MMGLSSIVESQGSGDHWAEKSLKAPGVSSERNFRLRGGPISYARSGLFEHAAHGAKGEPKVLIFILSLATDQAGTL